MDAGIEHSQKDGLIKVTWDKSATNLLPELCLTQISSVTLKDNIQGGQILASFSYDSPWTTDPKGDGTLIEVDLDSRSLLVPLDSLDREVTEISIEVTEKVIPVLEEADS